MQCLRGLCRNTHFETLPYPTNAEDVTELDDTDTDQKQKPGDPECSPNQCIKLYLTPHNLMI